MVVEYFYSWDSIFFFVHFTNNSRKCIDVGLLELPPKVPELLPVIVVEKGKKYKHDLPPPLL